MSERTTLIHPAAFVDPSAELGEGVEIGLGAYVGPECVIGAGTRLRPHAMVVAHTVLGERNDIHSKAVIGGDPQDRKFDPSRPGKLIVGDGNVFREGVTINRGVGDGAETRIGNDCYMMMCAHVGHNSIVGDGVTFANGACMAGHTRLGSGCFLSAASGAHQFCNVGELVMFQHTAGATMHVPPFVILASGMNRVAGLNRVGLMRCGWFTAEERIELKQAFKLVYRRREERLLSDALREAEESGPWGRAAQRFLGFIREAIEQGPPRRRGLCGPIRRSSSAALANPLLDT